MVNLISATVVIVLAIILTLSVTTLQFPTGEILKQPRGELPTVIEPEITPEEEIPAEEISTEDRPIHTLSTNVSACGVISSPGEYVLNSDITDNTTNPCMYINSSNVILDGAGFTMDGISKSTNAISVYNVTNVTIKNVIVKNYSTGMSSVLSNYSTIINNSMTDNTKPISLSYTLNNLIENNTITSNFANSWPAINISDSSWANISSNNLVNHFQSIYMVKTYNSTFTNMNITSLTTGEIVYYIRQSSDNNITGNTIDCNNTLSTGIRIDFFTTGTNNNNKIERSTIKNCRYGIYLGWQPTNTLINNNTFINNSLFGIYQVYGYSENITNNTFVNNRVAMEIGLYSGGAPKFISIDSNNIFNNSQGSISVREFTSNISVRNNNIRNTNNGISISGINSTVENNNITNAMNVGIFVNSASGGSASNNLIINNNIANCTVMGGIWLSDLSAKNTIRDNTIINSTKGIYVWNSNNSEVIRNKIINSSEYGVASIFSSSNNSFWDNKFENNFINAYDNGTNNWNTTKNCSSTNILGRPCIGGNYWSDYTGVDNTGDYLGDTKLPYNSSGNITNGGDYLPLVNFSSISACTTISSPGEYVLSGNITNSVANPCIYIASSNVILGGNGFTMNGVTGSTTGIQVYGGRENVTIKNLVIKNYAYGVYLNGLSYGLSEISIDNNTITNSSIYGIYLYYGNTYHNITNNNISYNTRGIEFASNAGYNPLDFINISNNIINNNIYGITQHPVGKGGGGPYYYITIMSNVISNNTNDGVVLRGNYAVIKNNTIRFNGNGSFDGDSSSTGGGIYFEGIQDGGSFSNNTASNNNGYSIKAVNFPKITNNIVYSNSYGIITTNTANVSYNNIWNNSVYGLTLVSSTAYNNNVTENNLSGIIAAASVVYNNNISDNIEAGLTVQGGGNYTRNIVQYNGYGVKTTGSSSKIWDNKFVNNSINTYDANTNNWNITKDCTNGVNIVDGPCTGGNYWSDYNGTDIDDDYIGDTDIPYNSSSNISTGGDYLPLFVNHLPALSTSVSNCGIINDPGEYILGSDISNNSNDPCLLVSSSDVIIDGNGYTVDGIDKSIRGIVLNNYHTNVTIKNLTLKEFSKAIIINEDSNTLIDNVTIVSNELGIRASKSYNTTISNNNISVNTETGIYIDNSDYVAIWNNKLKNNTINGILLEGNYADIFDNVISNNNYGIQSNTSTVYYYNNITNNQIINNTHPIVLDKTSNYIVKDNTINRTILSSGRAIDFYNSENATFDDNIIDNYGTSNFRIENTNNSIFTNMDMYFRGDIAYHMSNSINNTILNGTIDCTPSGGDGMYISNLVNSAIRNMKITNCDSGIEFNVSNNNNITRNEISDSSIYGIQITGSTSNNIWDNKFENNANAYDDGTNSWNTTKNCTTNANIINKSCIGGNYWSDYTGVDNTGDYLGDTNLPYRSSGNILTGGDYLPLTTSTEPIIPRTAGGYTSSGLPVYSIVAITDGQLITFNNIPVGTYKLAEITGNSIWTSKIVILQQMNGKLEIVQGATPSESADGKIYTYISAEITGFDQSAIDTFTLSFKVPKTWLTENGLSSGDISLLHYDGTKWNTLPTSITSEDNDYVYFEATSSELSYFAIGAPPKPSFMDIMNALSGYYDGTINFVDILNMINRYYSI